MKLIKFKSLAIAALIATTSVSLVGCGGAQKPSGTYTASFFTKGTIVITGSSATFDNGWIGYNAGYKDGTVELLDWGKYDQGAWYWKADFVLNSTYRGEECEYYQTSFSSKNGKKVCVAGYTYSK